MLRAYAPLPPGPSGRATGLRAPMPEPSLDNTDEVQVAQASAATMSAAPASKRRVDKQRPKRKGRPRR
ncbi:MAG: hypothetical protein HY903_03000 [Deltaproteobacteria bacterium]|nr:hypothetical protein [Deltaproteobacteria bacterium]